MTNYLVIDFETTGLDYMFDQTIEVALIKYDEEFNELGSFNTLIQLHEGNHLSGFIKDLTGLTEEDLATGMREDEAMVRIKGYIDEDTVVVAQYASFDLAFLAKFGIVPKRFICTKSLTSQVEPNVSSSLVPTCERLGIKLDNAHRAFADVKATAELLQYRFNQEEIIEYGENYIVKSPDRDLSFVPHATIAVLDKAQFMKEENQ